jgi:hypothetical protein
LSDDYTTPFESEMFIVIEDKMEESFICGLRRLCFSKSDRKEGHFITQLK